MWNFMFFLESILLGIGLAMDAFSMSLANGLHEPKMKLCKMCSIAGVFAFFQFLMPMIGWGFVHTLAQHFKVFERFIPLIALALLGYIGGKMLYEGIRCKGCEDCVTKLGIGTLCLQGIATSIDALSVGFTIADHTFIQSFVCCLLIAVVTFAICLAGLFIGKKFGIVLAGKASVLGGVILIAIGLEIFITGFFNL